MQFGVACNILNSYVPWLKQRTGIKKKNKATLSERKNEWKKTTTQK